MLKLLKLSIIASAIFSCKTDKLADCNLKLTLKATLKEGNKSPTNASKATVLLSFDSTINIFLLSKTSTGLTAAYGQIHKMGVNEPAAFILSYLSNAINYKSVALMRPKK